MNGIYLIEVNQELERDLLPLMEEHHLSLSEVINLGLNKVKEELSSQRLPVYKPLSH